MKFADAVVNGNVKGVRQMLQRNEISDRAIARALKTATKRSVPKNVFNLMDTNAGEAKDDVYEEIRKLLLAHKSMRAIDKEYKLPMRADANIRSTITSYFGGAKSRRRGIRRTRTRAPRGGRRTAKRVRKTRRRKRGAAKRTRRKRSNIH